MYRAMSAAAIWALMAGSAHCQSIRDGLFQSCYREEVDNGIRVRAYIGDRACIQFDPPRVIEGVWINDFEGSRFFEGVHTLREATPRGDSVWLTIDGKSETPAGLKRPDRHAYYVRFIGMAAHDMHRRECFDGYGHMGCSAGLVLVDHVIEAVDLGTTSPGRWPRKGAIFLPAP